jgi:uncharacterized protein YoxC
MTESPQQASRLDRIEAILERVATQQATNTETIAGLTSKIDVLSENVTELTYNVNSLTNDVTRVLSRSGVLDDVVLGLHETTETLIRGFEQHQRNFEQHQRNFEQHQRTSEENQRTTNAALERLEAILMQLLRRFE